MSPRPQIDRKQAETPLFMGVDVGGTNIKFGLVDNQGRTVCRAQIPTESEKSPEHAIPRIVEKIDSMLSEAAVPRREVAAVGLATPGTMDVPAGVILEPMNLPGWRNFPIRDRLSDASGYPVAYANDANAAAFGEYWVGTGREYPSLVMLTLGTGIGGGIIVNGMSIDGEHSHGSECGHTIIDCSEDARMCGCGKQGHLEAYASATALVKRTKEALECGQDSSLRGRVENGDPLTPLMLSEEAGRGDALSIELILETARFLGIGIVTVLHMIDPSTVILGGAMTFGGAESDLGRKFLDRIRQEVHHRALPVVANNVLIEFASLGSEAGYIGAAGIARREFLDS